MDQEPKAMHADALDELCSGVGAAERALATCALLRACFRRRLRAEELLLAALESIADTLPKIDRTMLSAVAPRLRSLAAILDSSSILGLLLNQRDVARHTRLRRQIHRLSLEERADSAGVLELAEAVEQILAETGETDIGALAYQLRGVLENRRRHLAWAAEVVEQDLLLFAHDNETLLQALAQCRADAEALQLLYPAV